MNHKISTALKGLGLAGLALSVGMVLTGCKGMSSCSSCSGKMHMERKAAGAGAATNAPAMPAK